MTMTRDKIEELKRLAKREDATFQEYWGIADIMKNDGYSHGLAEYLDACAPQTILSLLALAERALEPQGQADVFYAVLNPSGNEGVLFKDKMDAEYTATGDHARFGVPTLGDTFRECYADDGKMAVREVVLQSPASQLALPAGPVPEGLVLVPMHLNAEMRDVLSEEDWTWEDLLVAANAVTEEQYYAIQNGNGDSQAVAGVASAQPAPAEPLSDEFIAWHNEVLDMAADGETPDKETLVSWASRARHAAQRMASSARAQPVADERGWKWRDNPVAWYTLYKDGTRQILGYTKPVLADLVRELGKQAEDAVSRPLIYGDTTRAALGQPAEEGGKVE